MLSFISTLESGWVGRMGVPCGSWANGAFIGQQPNLANREQPMGGSELKHVFAFQDLLSYSSSIPLSGAPSIKYIGGVD